MNPEKEPRPAISADEQKKADDFVDRLVKDKLLSNPPGADPISRRKSLWRAESEVSDERLLGPVRDSYILSVERFAERFGLNVPATWLAVEQKFCKLFEENEADDTKF